MRPAADLGLEIRKGFEQQRTVDDLQRIKFLLSEGKQRMKQLSEMIGEFKARYGAVLRTPQVFLPTPFVSTNAAWCA